MNMKWELCKKYLLIVTILLVVRVLSAEPVVAGYPGYGYAPYYQHYSQTPYPYFGGAGTGIGTRQGFRPELRSSPAQSYYGYRQPPRWLIRGRINRFGDYRVDIKLRGISQYDMYRAWLLYNSMGANR